MAKGQAVNSVAIVGAGPAGFFAADALLKGSQAHVDLFERLPSPYGLVRYGVAPDHQKIKQVEAGFNATGKHERLRYFGNVKVGDEVSISELLSRYDQVVFAMGCQCPRKMGVEGENTRGVHTALNFVSWYNGHPDFVREEVSLDVRRVVVVGAGDVSMDICRLLSSTDSELRATDMPDYALSEFRRKHVENIHVLVRRGPQNASFAVKELRDVLNRDQVAVRCDEELVQSALTDDSLDRQQREKLELLLEGNQRTAEGKLLIHFEFLHSPSRFIEKSGHLAAVELEKNRLETDESGRSRAVGTGERRELDAELAVLAVGYRGYSLPDLPIDERSGVVPNDEGRVLDAQGRPDPQRYVVGWLARGPQGVIGTNKGHAKRAVAHMLENLPPPSKPRPDMEALLTERGISFVNFPQWLHLDELERSRGKAAGKVREKFTETKDALEALDEHAR